jgi:hypothetical protein
MTKTPTTKADKPPRKPRKRGPKEERLIITEDPALALQKLLRPKPKKA